MEKIHYEGPIEDVYIDEHFYNLMEHLNPGILISPTNPNLEDKTKAQSVNAWTLDGTIILYHAKYEIKEELMGLEDISAKITIYGPDEDSIESVEKKINGLIELARSLTKLDFLSAD